MTCSCKASLLFSAVVFTPKDVRSEGLVTLSPASSEPGEQSSKAWSGAAGAPSDLWMELFSLINPRLNALRNRLSEAMKCLVRLPWSVHGRAGAGTLEMALRVVAPWDLGSPDLSRPPSVIICKMRRTAEPVPQRSGETMTERGSGMCR